MEANDNNLSESKRILLKQRLQRVRGAVSNKSSTLSQRPKGSPTVASPGQQRIWLLHQLDPASPSCSITNSFHIKGKVDLDCLERSINRVIQRHDSLRSTFSLNDEVLMQLIRPTAEIKIERMAAESIDEIKAQFQSLVSTPFILDKGPLVRVLYGQFRENEAILTLVTHDIVFDKWSLILFWKEVSLFYQSELTGIAPELEPLPLQYQDFAYHQRKQIEEGAFSDQLSYWKETLKQLPEPLPLPTDRPYPPQLTSAGQLEVWQVSEATTQRLKDLAKQTDASLFTVLLYGLNVLLHGYTGQEDVLVGAPVANRRHKETAHLIGFFLNTLCIRTDLSGNPTLMEGLLRTRQATIGAKQNQDLPLDRIVDNIEVERVPGRHPLFQVMFVHQREDEGTLKLELGSAEIEYIFIDTQTAKFDFTLFVTESGDTLNTLLEYRTDLFDASTIHRLLGHYEVILEQLVANPDQRLNELTFLTESERDELLNLGQGDMLSFDSLPLVPDQIIHQAQASSGATAIQGSGETVTYGELHARVEHFASYMVAQGIQTGEHVGLLMQRSPDAIIALLAIMKTGAAYLPLDPDYPEERIRFMLEDANVSWIVTAPDLLKKAEALSLNKRCIAEAQVKEDSVSDKSSYAIKPDDTAYIIYTSGSTGKPKGVPVSHDNLRNSTATREKYYQIRPNRFLLIPNLSFDSSVAGIFWTLTTGGTLIIPEQTHLKEPDAMLKLITESEVNSLLCIPSLYQQWLGHGLDQINSLETVIVAGERCPPALVKQHFKALPKCQLFNEYGPTEATVWATVAELTLEDASSESTSIGKPIANCTAHVLDSHQRLLPVGFPGELYLGGKGITSGYLNRPELSQKSFITTEAFGRLYRTGDRAKWNTSGQLQFLGRNDEQVKLRGYRIEPGEIEAALLSHPEIEEAVVLANKRIPTSLEALMEKVPSAKLDALIDEIKSGSSEIHTKRSVRRESFRIDLSILTPDFVQPPRKAQRDWLLSQAMDEFSDDLEYLDLVSKEFVSGYDHKLERDLLDIGQTRLTADQIMEDWQVPIMKSMAEYATESRGDVLEIGFGRGVSAELIQQAGVQSHTIVEFNDHSITNYFKPWLKRHANKDIRLVHARWQDADDQLDLYDSIFFHAFPLNEAEFIEYVLKSVTFAEHAFAPMSSHLKPGGVFTYLTTEVSSLSRRHQRLLFKYFSSITLKVVPLNIPEDTHDTWWAPKMVVIKAVK